MEILIPSDDPVHLLSAFVEGMELSDLYRTYGKIKKNQASPRQLFKIIIYASMNRIYSSRDINFMYLLEGKPAPDHATIARFISLHFSQCSKKTLAEVTGIFYKLGENSGKSIFIDGTKIESAANKYTFVWKKSALQKSVETLETYIEKLKEYTKKLHVCGECNSYSKTDPDATFMRGNTCKTPMEERQKVLYVSKVMKEKRQEILERITSDYGTQLRMNRSIQAEGSFAVIKEDMDFRETVKNWTC